LPEDFLLKIRRKIRSYFPKNQETIKRYFQKTWMNIRKFLNHAKKESIRQFSLGEAKLPLLKTLATSLDQASNGNIYLTREIKEREMYSRKCFKISEMTIWGQKNFE